MGPIGDISPGGSIALGILAGLLSTSVQSLGLTLQRKSHILEDEKGPHDVRRPPHRRRRWQLGMGMFIMANLLGSTVQISTLPLPVLSTLQASGLVFNSICATLILGEPFTRWSMYGTCLVCSGAVLIAIFGAIPAPAHNLEELLKLLGRRPFVAWMILQALVVIAIAVVTDLVNAFTNLSQNNRFRLIRGFAYGCISGILSAHSLLLAKLAVELIVRTIADRDNQFVHWQSWALVIALVVLALSQLYYLHRGLKLVSTSVLYPLVFCIYNIIAILDGLIYFRQTDLISPLHAALIAAGTCILLSGVLALSWRLSDEQHQPAVGQGSLAPGLGLVEDTEGEEEDLDLVDSDIIIPSDDSTRAAAESRPLLMPSYQTFSSHQEAAAAAAEAPLTPTTKAKKTGPRWQEHHEIWGELLDRDDDTAVAASQREHARRRSMTLPVFHEGSSLLGSGGVGRAPTTPGSSHTVDASAMDSRRDSYGSKKLVRKRRKSTGFPGFMARRTPSRKVSAGQTRRSTEGGEGRSPLSSLLSWRRFWKKTERDAPVARRMDLEEGNPDALPGQGVRWPDEVREETAEGDGRIGGRRYRDDPDGEEGRREGTERRKNGDDANVPNKRGDRGPTT